MLEKVKEAAEYLVNCGIGEVKVGIVLGTGLENLVEHITIIKSVTYKDIPHFPESRVDLHSGHLIYGTLAGKKVLVMKGRFHFYEGHNLQEVTFPIRVMKLLGVETVLLSNACGSVNPDYEPASLMIIDDHINMLPGNPLIGVNYPEFGPRFIDMSQPYDADIILKIEAIAKKEKIELNKGIYVAWMGPSLETRAEYRFIKTMGADVVGMSTVPEVIVANHMGMKVAAISVITDLCDPDRLKPLDINEVLNNAAIAEKKLTRIFIELVKEL
jgi:purine-nucleoside phosphorylase